MATRREVIALTIEVFFSEEARKEAERRFDDLTEGYKGLGNDCFQKERAPGSDNPDGELEDE